jgi:dTDP-3-amino-3,4,6-trideoxy-alpha-D-glucose transaminase
MNAGHPERLREAVPFMSLQRHHEPLEAELKEAFGRVLAEGGFVLGSETEKFEDEFAAYCQVSHCVGVNSGTAALTLALLAVGVGAGDEVIVPAHTFIASALAVLHAGATPVFCDVQLETGLLDPDAAAAAVGPRTAAVLAVHLYGQACDMDAISRLADRHGLAVVEDAAQAHGARWRGARTGSLGTVAAFSFYPSKNLGALGDGGAICTDDEAVARRVRRLRNLGQEQKGLHVEAGFNDRLDGIQAAMLRVKLRCLDDWNARRGELAAAYDRILEGVCPVLQTHPQAECVYHLYPVLVERRELVRQQLTERGIGTGIHYHPAVPAQPPLADLPSSKNSFPNAQRWAEQELSLPLFPELSAAEAEHVAGQLREAIEVHSD